MDKDDNTVIAHVIEERCNKEFELAVNRGLAAALLAGVPAGLKIMLDAGVPLETCMRVLNNQTQHRASDWH